MHGPFLALVSALLAALPAVEPQSHYDVEQAPSPCWRGPYSNGSMPSSGIKLVDDLSQAKLVWTSDQQVPGAYPRAGGVNYWTGGYCVPLVADGRVYVHYWTLPGRTTYEYTDDDLKHLKRMIRNPFLPDETADDVVHCFDAKTGMTLWRTAFAAKGWTDPNADRAHMSSLYYQGRIYAPGSKRHFYCVEAATGERVWEVPIQEDWNAKKPPERLAVPCAVDGVVALYHKGLHGFDAQTGEKKWSVRTTSGGRESPVVWLHEGKGYFYLAGSLIEAATGKKCWDMTDNDNWEVGVGTAAAVANDLLVVKNIRKFREKDGFLFGPSAFRISPQGYERLWSYEKRGHQRPPVTIANGLVIDFHGKVNARLEGAGFLGLDLLTGELKKHHMPGTGNPHPLGYHPIVAEGKLFAAKVGAIAMMDVTGDSFGVWQPGQIKGLATCISPAYANGFLYLRTRMSAKNKKEPSKVGDGPFSRVVCYDVRAP